MRATVMHGAGDVRIESVPDPRLVEPTDAILRVTRACICGSDLWPYASMEPSETGQSMGHEARTAARSRRRDTNSLKPCTENRAVCGGPLNAHAHGNNDGTIRDAGAHRGAGVGETV